MRNRVVLFVALLCALNVFTSCSSDNDDVPAPEPQQEIADYTILYYGHGGGSLDIYLLKNIAQFFEADAESYKNVSICAQYKFSTLKNLQQSYVDYEEWMDPNDPAQVTERERIKTLYPFAEKTCRFVVDPKATSSDVMDVMTGNFIGLDNAYISRTDSLVNFINWAAKMRPARKYILVLADHGDGYLPIEEVSGAYSWAYDAASPRARSVIKDDGHNKDHFTAKSLSRALSQTSVRVSAVYCDACLMNSAEYQFELAPVTDYLVLSTFLVPGAGGNYTELVNALSANPDNIEPALTRFAKFCVEAWDKDAEIEDKGENLPYYHDMSVYRTANIDAFGAELKKFVDCLIDVYQNGDDELRAKIDDITANAYRVDEDQPTYDLMNYIIRLYMALPDEFAPTMINIADMAYNHCFVYQKSSKWLDENGHTVSISVMLGCQGHFINREKGVYYLYEADGLRYRLSDDGERIGEGTSWYSTLDATYGQLRFDKITGWSRWLRINQQEPNSKCYVEQNDLIKRHGL